MRSCSALALLVLLSLSGCATTSAQRDGGRRAADLQAEAIALLARADSLRALPGPLAPADSAWLTEVPARFDSLQAEYTEEHRLRWPLSTTLLVSGALLAATLFFYAINPANFQ